MKKESAIITARTLKVEVDQSKFERIQNVLIGNNSVALEKMNQWALKVGQTLFLLKLKNGSDEKDEKVSN